MRILHNGEQTQRGCKFCAEAIPPDNGGKRYVLRSCPHEECPYHELDKVETYQEYLKNAKVGGLAKLLANLTKE
jgi:Fe-S-cluster-containing dehydrogenase component